MNDAEVDEWRTRTRARQYPGAFPSEAGAEFSIGVDKTSGIIGFMERDSPLHEWRRGWLHTKEAAIRNALIELGWTPPGGTAK